MATQPNKCQLRQASAERARLRATRRTAAGFELIMPVMAKLRIISRQSRWSDDLERWTVQFEPRAKPIAVEASRPESPEPGELPAAKTRGNFSVLQPVEKSRNAIGISRRPAPRAMGAGIAHSAGSRMPRSKPEGKFSGLQTLE